MKVLLSIKPKYVEEINKGSKLYEFRKVIFNDDIKTIYVYETDQKKKIVGKIIIDDIIEDSPLNLWQKFEDKSGIAKHEFFEYFKDRNKGYAIKIKKYVNYKKPIDPYKNKPNFVPPQSYLYVDNIKNFVSAN